MSDPEYPDPVGNMIVDHEVNDLEVLGDLACIAATDLYIFDVSDPAAPELVGSLDPSGWAVGIYVQGDYAYLAQEAT